MYKLIIKKIYIGLTLLLTLSFNAVGSHQIFLTTQAETKHIELNPPLSQCGRLRAEQLSTLLSHANIKYVYSTPEFSTMETANPIAKMKGLPVKIFTPALVGSLAITATELNNNALIVANNETIQFLIEFISKNKIELSAPHNQNLLYQLIIIKNEVVINIFKQPLQC